ncbi:MAG: leucine-rich repeat domain-containing protein [Ruminococcus sp.]|jgi:hypothetical protein|nr:leucine-rich repeat domain-containing protein [Ruminococcus sp.]
MKKKFIIAISLCLALCAGNVFTAFATTMVTTEVVDPVAEFLNRDESEKPVDSSEPEIIPTVSLSYRVVDYSNITITGCEPTLDGKFIIPERLSVSIRGKDYSIPVTKIGPHAFEACRDITGIEIPKTVTYIDNYAFNLCTRLKYANIPTTVSYIGERAFGSCKSLESIEIPVGVSAIQDKTFFSCWSLKDVVIPSTVSRIGDYAFSECVSLMNIKLPETVSKIDSYAFSQSGLTSIKIPKSVKSIGSQAFYACVMLSEVTIPDDGDFLGIGYETFYGCTSLKAINIPATTVVIGYRAFLLDTDIVVTCKENSYVERYCHENNISFQKVGSMSWIVDRYKNRNFAIPNPEYTVNDLGLN